MYARDINSFEQPSLPKMRSPSHLKVLLIGDYLLSHQQTSHTATLHHHLQTISDWHLFGVYLGLPTTKLDLIRQECPAGTGHTSGCLLRMLQVWLESGEASWAGVGEALSKMPSVVCAHNIEKQCQIPY